MSAAWTCASCEFDGNAADSPACESCDDPRPASASATLSIVVGLITTLEPVPQKDKLRVATIDVGGSTPVAVVTNAPNVAVGARVVVALPGAVVRGEGGEDVAVKAATVGGVKSGGMLCDGPMLGWVGGGAGLAALVPASCDVGSAPPAAKPRLK